MDTAQALDRAFNMADEAIATGQYSIVISSLTLGVLVAFCVMFWFKHW